jgi:hypothetical protein
MRTAGSRPRRACGSDASARDVKNGTSMTAKTASEPPTTYADHRRRAARRRNQEQGRDGAAPFRVTPPRGCRRSRANVELAAVLLERSLVTGVRCYGAGVLPTGRSQSMNSAAGDESCECRQAANIGTRHARTATNPANGIQRNRAWWDARPLARTPAAVDAGREATAREPPRARGRGSQDELPADVAGGEKRMPP